VFKHQNKIMHMKRNFSLLLVMSFVLMCTFSVVSAQTKWTVDKAHTNVKFAVTHMLVSEVEGSFQIFDGTLENTKEDFSDAKVNFTVDVNSVNTNNARRDADLKSENFFNTKVDSVMKFESTGIKVLGNNKYEMTGNLTIKGITKPIVFQVSYGGTVKTQNGAKSGFKARATINRFDYNLKWDRAVETGGLVVSKDVDITINVEMNQAKQ
jgi:polyisoprenoid-binding protein YceI